MRDTAVVDAVLVTGNAGMGVVADLGPGADKFEKGQRVFGLFWPTRLSGEGTWQQYVVIAEKSLVSHCTATAGQATSQVCSEYFLTDITEEEAYCLLSVVFIGFYIGSQPIIPHESVSSKQCTHRDLLFLLMTSSRSG